VGWARLQSGTQLKGRMIPEVVLDDSRPLALGYPAFRFLSMEKLTPNS